MQHLPPTDEETEDFKEYYEVEAEMLKLHSLERMPLYPVKQTVSEWDMYKSVCNTRGQDKLVRINASNYTYLVRCSSGNVLMSEFKKAQ